MLEVIVNGEHLELPQNVSLEIEDTNPIFNDRGSQSLPLTVPATGQNRRLLAFPELLYTSAAPNNPGIKAEVRCKSYQRKGALNITSASRRSGISFNLGFDNSMAYEKWQNLKLSELSGLSVIELPVGELLTWLGGYSFQPEDPGLAVFPIVVSKEEVTSGESKKYVYEILNSREAMFNRDGKMKFRQVIDNKMTTVSAPAGYAVSPFIKVWRLLELVFGALGVQIMENPMKEDIDLERLVVLNNTMDQVATGRLNYAELMPDCTVAELMNALWVRFGLTYVVNVDTATVRLRLLKDILEDKPALDFDDKVSDFETVTYESPRYVKLSAATSIDGAQPPAERYEDFMKDSERNIIVGGNVAKWMGSDAGKNLAGVDEDSRITEIVGMELVEHKWYRLDCRNNQVKNAGSSFFNWDPQPEGVEALDLSSVDECVPVEFVDTQYQDTNISPRLNIKTYCPMFLVGSRHRHSELKGAAVDEDSEKDEETPLSFMFAFNGVGRLSPETIDVTTLNLPEGAPAPRLTLYFQFEEGLYATFWRKYDEIIRHANRTVEVPICMSLSALRSLDMLSPVRLRGVRCLIDTMAYSLPADNPVAADLKLRVLQTHGSYDVEVEQKTAPINLVYGHIEWKLLRTNTEEFLAAIDRQEIIDTNMSIMGFTPGWKDDGYYHFYDPEYSLVLKDLRYSDNPGKWSPSYGMNLLTRNVSASTVSVSFDVYEIKTKSPGNPSGYIIAADPDPWHQTRPGVVNLQLTYAPIWVNDVSFGNE